MKPSKLLLAAVCILISRTHEIKAQWTDVNGPGWVTAFAFTPNGAGGTNLFAGTLDQGVFLSADDGTTWAAVNKGLESQIDRGYPMNALVVNSTDLFAGTGGGLLRSNNNGTSWAATGFPKLSVYALAVSGTNLFAGTDNGTFLSTNNGTSWSAVNTGLTNTRVLSLAVSGTNLFAGTDSSGVFRSTDNGTSWIAVNGGLTNTFVNALAAAGANLFAGTDSGAFLSTNNGMSWTEVNAGLPKTTVRCFAIVPASGGSGATNVLAATSYNGVFLSTNNGGSWTATGLKRQVSAFGLSGTSLFAGSDYGVFRSKDNGASWTAVSGDLAYTPVPSLTVVPDEKGGTNVFAGTFSRGVLCSTDNGASWISVNTGLRTAYGYIPSWVYGISAFPDGAGGTNLFAGTTDGVFLSTNDGVSWTAAGLAGSYVYAFAVTGTNLFAGTAFGVYLSTNNGTSWTAVNTGLTDSYRNEYARNIHALAASPNGRGGTNLFAGTGNGVFRSTDNGASWTAVNNGLPWGSQGLHSRVYQLAVCPTAGGGGGTNLFAATAGVYRSSDDGATWTATGLTGPFNVEVLAVSGTNVFAARDGILLSTDNGARWSAVDNRGLRDTWVTSLAVSPNETGGVLFAGTRRSGVYRRSLSEMITAVKEAYTSLPEGYSLQQNYPNPFNPSTTIRFSLPKSGRVTLKVYDILGREVETLVDGERPAGSYNVEWTPNNLASGVYLYRIEAGAFSDVKRLLLLK